MFSSIVWTDDICRMPEAGVVNCKKDSSKESALSKDQSIFSLLSNDAGKVRTSPLQSS